MKRALLALLVFFLVPATGFSQIPQTVEYYHTDAHGNVRAVTKVINGQVVVVARYDYMPFGELVDPPSPLPTNRLFTGEERDPETGFDYFGARYLISGLARFTTVDPANASAVLHDPQGWNAYAYARNNPSL